MPAEDPIDAVRKLDFLMRHAVPRSVLGHEATMVSFAERLGVARKTLIDQRDKGALSSYVQGELATKLRFSLAWREWLTGTLEEFRDRYSREHQATIPDATPPPRQHDPGVRLRSVRLEPARLVDEARANLASLTLFLEQAGPGESIPVSVEIVCQPEPAGNFSILVRRGRLEIAPAGGEIVRTPPPLATDGPVTLKRGNHVVTLQRANASRPGRQAWTVHNDAGPIGVLRLEDEMHLCRIGELAPGDEVVATFQVYLKDLDLGEPDPEDDTDDRADPYSFLREDGKPLSTNKRQIIKRLLLKDALGESEKAWHTLAEDRRRLEKDGV